MVAVGLQRTAPGLAEAVHQIVVRPAEEGTAAAAAAGQAEVGHRGRTGELPENEI
jgi:hypothetical protein